MFDTDVSSNGDSKGSESYRIRWPKEHEEMLSKLCKNSDGKGGNIFDTYKEALVFCACVGFEQSRKKTVVKSGEPIAQDYFKAMDHVLINCMALADSNDPNILSKSRSRDKFIIFEEFAAAGMDDLRTRVFDQANWSSAFLEWIQSQNPAFANKSGILGQFGSLLEGRELT